MKKVGIFSGTFDPVHAGHLAFAREAVAKCELEKVFFLVEPRPRRKQGVKAFEHRTRMVQLAIADEPRFGSIITEQQRFTVMETLPVLAERFRGAQICMLIGDDGLAHLSEWPHIEDLAKQVKFIIGLRQMKESDARDALQTMIQTKGLPMNYKIFHVDKSDISSSSIKHALRANKPASGLPPKVAEYIAEKNLYTQNQP